MDKPKIIWTSELNGVSVRIVQTPWDYDPELQMKEDYKLFIESSDFEDAMGEPIWRRWMDLYDRERSSILTLQLVQSIKRLLDPTNDP
jgi:hypothetical protein